MLQILPNNFAAPRESVRSLAASNVCLTAPPSCGDTRCNSSIAEQRSGNKAETSSVLSFDLKWTSPPGTSHCNVWATWPILLEDYSQNGRTDFDGDAGKHSWVWLGNSVLEQYKVVELPVPQGSMLLRVAVQPANALFETDSLANATKISVDVSSL